MGIDFAAAEAPDPLLGRGEPNVAMESSDQQVVFHYRDSVEADAVARGNRDVVVGAMQAMISGNDKPFWEMFDGDVVFHEASSLPFGGVHRGLDAAKRACGNIFQTFSSLREEIQAIAAAADMVFLYFRLSYVVAANGNSDSVQVTETFRFCDGKVVEWRAFYFDPEQVARKITGA